MRNILVLAFAAILSCLAAFCLTGLLFSRASAATPAPVEAPAGGQPIVIGQGYDLPSKILRETRRINVWLPPGYAEGTKTYPVLYLMDGGLCEDFHHITGLTQVGAMNGYLREVIVVGVADTDRRHDLTYPSSDPRDHKDAPTGGGSADFRRFLGEELQPWVRAHYRTSGETALMGESLAGLFVVETLLKRPAMFDTYIAASPSLWWDNHSLEVAAPALLKAMPPGARRLYLTVGDEGRAMGVEALAAVLKVDAHADLAVVYQPMPAEKHSTILHPAASAALRRLYPAPTSAPK